MYGGWVKNKNDGPICGPKFIKFWDGAGDPLSFPILFTIVYSIFSYKDSGR